ncbi:MAG: copper homeostasis protein CutC [Bacteroidales bacterium]|nr:copper homeostasis protein CutC [Bacteroidales bacterium]
MPLLEICAGSVVSAKRAEQGGAQRIELCEQLEVGGVTPSIEMLQEVLASTNIRTHVLIRTRPGDFIYSNQEIDAMVASVLAVKNAGAHGVVIGALDRSGRLDESAITTLINAANGLSLTFHRAIDVANEPMLLLEKIIDFGFDYVLTSGQQASAEAGIPLLKTMQQQFGKHISIIAGGGINSLNIGHIAMETAISQFHASARNQSPNIAVGIEHQFGIRSNNTQSTKPVETNLDEVKRLSAFCQGFTPGWV